MIHVGYFFSGCAPFLRTKPNHSIELRRSQQLGGIFGGGNLPVGRTWFKWCRCHAAYAKILWLVKCWKFFAGQLYGAWQGCCEKSWWRWRSWTWRPGGEACRQDSGQGHGPTVGHGRRDMGHGLGRLGGLGQAQRFHHFHRARRTARVPRWKTWTMTMTMLWKHSGGSWRVLEGSEIHVTLLDVAGSSTVPTAGDSWDVADGTVFIPHGSPACEHESRTAWQKLRTTMSRTISWNGQMARWVWSFGCCASLCIFPSTTHCWALSCFHSQKDRPNLPAKLPWHVGTVGTESRSCRFRHISTKAMAPKGTEVVHGLLWSFFALDRELCFPSGLVDWDRSPAKLSETEWNCVLNTLFLAEQRRGILRCYTAQVAAIIGVLASEWDFCSHWLQDMWKKCKDLNKNRTTESFPLNSLESVSKIPTIISGLTFLAAATSIPDAVSSMAVARKGGGCGAATSTEIQYVSGKLTVCYWKWPFVVDLPIKNGDFP